MEWDIAGLMIKAYCSTQVTDEQLAERQLSFR
jgi:hypothetical protein